MLCKQSAGKLEQRLWRYAVCILSHHWDTTCCVRKFRLPFTHSTAHMYTCMCHSSVEKSSVDMGQSIVLHGEGGRLSWEVEGGNVY